MQKLFGPERIPNSGLDVSEDSTQSVASNDQHSAATKQPSANNDQHSADEKQPSASNDQH